MPIYIYECDSCGTHFERMQRFADQPLSECPECGGHVHRIIQPVGVIFRGSGFYVTDNRQVSSPTLKPAKDSDTSPAHDADSGGEPEKEHVAPQQQAEKEPPKPGGEPVTAPKAGAPD